MPDDLESLEVERHLQQRASAREQQPPVRKAARVGATFDQPAAHARGDVQQLEVAAANAAAAPDGHHDVAMSGHNSYWTWGPAACSGDVVIVIGGGRGGLESVFESVERVIEFTCADCMPYENHKPIWVCRGMRLPIDTLWPELRDFN